MGLTQVSTDGVKNDAITKTKIPANQIETSEIASGAVTSTQILDNTIVDGDIADATISLAKLEHGTSSNDGKFLRANNGADPTFETITVPASINNLVEDTSPQLGGNLASNGNNINMADNDEIVIGNSNDLILRHIPSSRHEILASASAPFQIRADTISLLSENGVEDFIKMVKNGSVDLYYDSSKKLETTANGVTLTGKQIIEIGSTDAVGLDIHSDSSVRPAITMDSNRSAAHNTIASISAKWNGTEVSRIATEAGRDTTNKDDAIIVFSVAKSGSSPAPASWISSYGHNFATADCNGWATYHMSPRGISDVTNTGMQGYGLIRHVKNVTAGSSTQATSLIRVMRYYWGHGFYKITLRQHYYSSVNEADWYLEGNGRYDSPYNNSYSLSHHNRHGSISSGVVSLSESTSSPSHTSCKYVDVIANIPAYEQFIVEIVAATPQHWAPTVSSTFTDVNCYALH